VAAPAENVTALGMALPEARVAPGMEGKEARRWADAALSQDSDAAVLLDAAALERLWTSARLRRRKQDGTAGSCIVTPHAGELAAMTKLDGDAIAREPERAAAEAAAHLGVLVVLKAGATTTVVAADGALFRQHARIPGLATSGAGDVLAGLIGGLLARGTAPIDACLWGVFLHAEAGRRLGARIGSIGYRAGELQRRYPADGGHEVNWLRLAAVWRNMRAWTPTA
jgi:NAD(P)H-hydrate repair Nnr-like enzyme with NAD(P)H-hydrate dehydratase domain